jgi:hypothetical protein
MILVDFAVGAAALDTLRVEEQAGVLELLLRSAPRLATDAERIARELLADTGVETVAERWSGDFGHGAIRYAAEAVRERELPLAASG